MTINKAIIGIVVVLVGVGAVGWWMGNKGKQMQLENSNQTQQISKSYTLAEIGSHIDQTSCWMAISGKVYDVTSYISEHPNNQIVDGCGKDATAMFEAEMKHRGKATRMLTDYEIGSLAE